MDYINVTSPPSLPPPPPPLLLYFSAILLPIILIFIFLKPTKNSTPNLPPGPPGWPMFGHIFMLKHLPHVTMAKMKDKYGPVVWLKIGSINTMVVLTANAAAEVYKNHDLDFSPIDVFWIL
ncbi:hypothetical protein LIER_31643 [Lithospermum erythrorhizon]|uniref:Cytochrome P450 n=1 Tax=Lithospermum erythrorhizon TaxID=34254 RepID=A0AAV3RV58_LITER